MNRNDSSLPLISVTLSQQRADNMPSSQAGTNSKSTAFYLFFDFSALCLFPHLVALDCILQNIRISTMF